MSEPTDISQFVEADSNNPPSPTLSPTKTPESATNSGTPPNSSTTDQNLTSDEYGTPRWLIDLLTDDSNRLFSLDPAAGAEPPDVQIAHHRFIKTDDSLTQSWIGPQITSIYLNPPYSNPEPFLRKLKRAVDPDDPNRATYAISLTKADTSTTYFQRHLSEANLLCFIDQRLSFIGSNNDAAFANVIGIFGKPPEALLDRLATIGSLYSEFELNGHMEQQQIADLVSDGDKTHSTESTHIETLNSKEELELLSAHDKLELTFTENPLVTGTDQDPTDIRVRLLPGGKSIDSDSGAVTLDTTGTTKSGTDVCAQVQFSPPTDQLNVAIATGMGQWKQVQPQGVKIS